MSNDAVKSFEQLLRSSLPDTKKFELRPCPTCRGYALEQSWCDACNKTGVIKVGNRA